MVLLNLLLLRLAKTELRYIVLDNYEGFSQTVPLFLGADLMALSLNDPGIAPNNYCRIHARYAKKNLATKLMFPSDISVSGLTNCLSGAWFYSIQGVFQLLFEHHKRDAQLEVLSALMEIWKTSHASPPLTYSMNISMKRLIVTSKAHQIQLQSSELLHSCTEMLNVLPAIDGYFLGEISQMNSIDLSTEFHSVENDYSSENIEISSEWDVEESEILPCIESTTMLCNNLLNTTRKYFSNCSSEDRGLVNTLISFIELLKTETTKRDDLFCSFFELICDYNNLVSDKEKYAAFSNEWNLTNRQNILLCLTSEWLGRKLAVFSDLINEKVAAFKSKNLNEMCRLPPPDNLVEELFPRCMLLLIGHWIGLYSPAQDTTFPSEMSVKDYALQYSTLNKSNQGSRNDHSYSSPLDLSVSSKEDASSISTNKKSRSLHHYENYSSSVTGTSCEHNYSSSVDSVLHCQDDHTYVASAIVEYSSDFVNSNRKNDHTYDVSRKERRVKGLEQQNSKKPNVPPKRTVTDVILDPSKYPFVQLVLEFMNSSLISGVAHVVYTRLLQSL